MRKDTSASSQIEMKTVSALKSGTSLEVTTGTTVIRNGGGYYLYCTPCKITQHSTSNGTSYNTISQILGKGNKLLLKEVSRRSKKAETEAIALAKEKEQFLLERVLTRYGLELEVQQ